MVARTRPSHGLLVVSFHSGAGKPREEQQVVDAERAAATAITLIAARLRFQPGDTVTCRWADDEPDDLPAVSRTSHMGG
jgi:hypothetical protein